MALPALVELEGLDARGVDVSDSARALAAIEDASALIHHSTGNRWVVDDAIDAAMPPVVRTIAYRVIGRALSNPDNLESSQIGPFQESYRASDGGMYLTAGEKDMLRNSTGTTSGLSVIRIEAPWGTRRMTLTSEESDESDDVTGS